MKIRKAAATAGFILCMGIMTAGCAKTTENSPQAEAGETMAENGQTEGSSEDAEDMEQSDSQADAAGQDVEQSGEADGQTADASQETEHLGGKVQNPQEDGMILVQTTVLDENGAVTILDEKDAEKIPVKFLQETKAEHWIIQGNGGDIDMQKADLSDLEEGMLIELEGYFEGDCFVATRVIIEEYA